MSIIYTDNHGIDHKTAGKEVPGIATNTDFGVVQFTDSKGVTSDNGLALSAKEKNKDVSGTLAADINELSNKLGDVSSLITTSKNAVGAINEIKSYIAYSNISWKATHIVTLDTTRNHTLIITDGNNNFYIGQHYASTGNISVWPVKGTGLTVSKNGSKYDFNLVTESALLVLAFPTIT